MHWSKMLSTAVQCSLICRDLLRYCVPRTSLFCYCSQYLFRLMNFYACFRFSFAKCLPSRDGCIWIIWARVNVRAFSRDVLMPLLVWLFCESFAIIQIWLLEDQIDIVSFSQPLLREQVVIFWKKKGPFDACILSWTFCSCQSQSSPTSLRIS